MEYNFRSDVIKFRKMAGLPISTTPVNLPYVEQEQHFNYIDEEQLEFYEAIEKNDKVGMVDAMLDMIVFCEGALIHAGCNEDSFDRFTRSIARSYFFACAWLNRNNIEIFPLLKIVMESNISKACDTNEDAEMMAEKYLNEWRNADEPDYDSRIEIIEVEDKYVLHKKFISNGALCTKLLKGNKFVAPEEKLKEELIKQGFSIT